MRASTSRACGSVCSVGTAAPPTNSPRSSPASTTARTRFTPCTGARSEPTRSEWTRRCAVSLEEPPPGITAKELRKTLEEGGSATGEATAARPTPATTTALAMIGALALVIPVARVYMLTKQRQGYDPSVVQTVILLP